MRNLEIKKDMAIIVKKFGGTSIGNIDLIRNIAHKLACEYHKGDALVLVVSAMAKTTDYLFNLAYGISQHPSRRELDMLLTAGERISMSLLSLALMEEGIPSISFTGSQSGIITDEKHGNAQILKVSAFRIQEELNKGKVVIVAGFQGVSISKEITTLGRGGSDTSAVALACYLGADKCEIYTDVDGVYTADPKLVANPQLLKYISPELMLTLCYNGSKVLHPRAVEFAIKYGVEVEVKSSFTFAPGSLITRIKIPNNEEDKMEERKVTAISYKDKLIRYIIPVSEQVSDMLTLCNYEIYKSFINAGFLELFVETKYETEVDYFLQDRGIEPKNKESNLAFVNLVGLGLGHDPAFLASVIENSKNYNILRSYNNEQSIELLLPNNHLSEVVQKLHTIYIEEKQ
ncbi:MAG TPA: aspartate kinase [Candidatus Cloacimonas sp.]|jgi:aspartate kinase|nr:aspartate kinase [Candidatus Cloacimonas sp.]